MKIGIVNPYLASLGGGEQYVLSIASGLSQNHEVTVFTGNPGILDVVKNRFHLDVSKLRTYKSEWSTLPFFKRVSLSRSFDVMFFVSDGSIPLSFSKKTILLLQFPVPWVNASGFFVKEKLKHVNTIVCYSEFVRMFLKETFPVPIVIIPPGIDSTQYASGKKKKMILTVGRFTTAMNTKKQEVLIDVFKHMVDDGLSDWSLVLAGGVIPGDMSFVTTLKDKAKGYPIQIHTNIDVTILRKLFKDAFIYWHGAGFGEDLKTHPERAEHFGITTVEAMASGAVPIVYNGGGQREVVDDGINGLLWNTVDELVTKTMGLMKNHRLYNELQKKALIKAKEYSREKLCEKFSELIEE